MFDSIVVAIDGSSHARRAVDMATSPASRYGSKLTLPHVMQNGPVAESLVRQLQAEHLVPESRPEPRSALDVSGNLAVVKQVGHAEFDDDRLHEVLAERLTSQAANAARAVGVEKIEKVIAQGEPAEVIVNCAKGARTDMIVMGRRGLSDLKGLVIGQRFAQRCQERRLCVSDGQVVVSAGGAEEVLGKGRS